MADKKFISAQALLEDSFELGAQILQSDFRPNFIVGVWRGGTPVGIAVQELLDFFGVQTDHIAIRTSSYVGIEDRAPHIRVHGLNYIVERVNHDDSLLIVDDVWDTGLSVEAVIGQLRRKARRNTPRHLRVATIYFKPGKNKTDRVPDFYVHETDGWLVFPHELHGLTQKEILANKPSLRPLLQRLSNAAAP
ncbi:MAG: hypoxanthine phosphoribosyltransferase [Gammaproteobacteria bacterium]|nr:hypoxanthine phosphoribosyltransferase [Gammaproteobacteria bacterium]NIR88834.1 hypoxanthine phosphoribosyltransferase [Gammaproteobacteria bacterium]NIU06438.1 hypoxanthine phosphoribosyltransferase [Gammaproteobacteria bacterium]NIV53330.1 hypoxanthine phosphoribosyltransferase [Gammaproteobacteria bacterium]NIV74049.1 hypoxanthine phosphoribosyltransferase [Gammaproteobacteria bacterium]